MPESQRLKKKWLAKDRDCTPLALPFAASLSAR
jgi:hypothetical protein